MKFRNAGLVAFAATLISLFLNIAITRASVSGESGSPVYPDSIAVGVRVDLPPYAFINEYGRADGFSVELLNESAALMGLTLDIRMGPIEKLKESLFEGDIDIIVGLEYTEENADRAIFGQPHTIIYDAIYFREDGPRFDEISDLEKRRVVVLENDIARHFLGAKNITENIREVETVAEALKAVAGGKAEAAMVPLQSAQIIIDSYNLSGLDHSQYPISDYHRSLSFAGSKDAVEQLSLLEQGLSLMRTNGAYDRVFNRWLGKYHPGDFGNTRVIRYALIAGLILTGLLAGMMAWAMYLRRKIAMRTRVLAREINTREMTNEELKTYRMKLEQLVEERTVHLKERVANLEQEAEESNKVVHNLERDCADLRRALEISGDARWSYDIDRGIILWSKEVYSLFELSFDGYTPSLQRFVDIFEAEDSARFRIAMDRIANSGGIFVIELERTGNNSDRKFFQISGMGITDGIGRICRIEGTICDISERKTVERDWRKAFIDWMELFETVDNPLIALNGEMNITRFNRAAEETFDRRCNRVLGRQFFDTTFPEFKGSELERKIYEVMQARSAVRFEMRVRSNSSEEWFEAAVSPYLEGVAVGFRAITAMKETERKLVENEQYAESLLKNIESLKLSETRLNRINRTLRSLHDLVRLLEKEKNPHRLSELVAGRLKDDFHLPEIRVTLIDRNLKPDFMAVDGTEYSPEDTVRIKKDEELPKCCKGLLFTNDTVHRVDPEEDCPNCHLNSSNCSDSTFVASMKSSNRFRGFVHISGKGFGDGPDEAEELISIVSESLTGTLENIESDERYEDELKNLQEYERMLDELSGLFRSVGYDDAERKFREGLRILTQADDADLGLIILLEDKEPILLNEWHENGFEIDAEWFGRIETDSLDRFTARDRKISGDDHASELARVDFKRILGEKLGLRTTSVFPIKKNDKTIAAIILASETDAAQRKIDNTGYLQAAVNIFTAAINSYQNGKIFRTCRRELNQLLNETSNGLSENPEGGRFTFDSIEEITESHRDQSDMVSAIDMNNLIDEILSDLFYTAREKNISLIRVIDIPFAEGARDEIQTRFRRLINSLIENSYSEKKLILEIGYDGYILSSDGRMGGYFIRYPGDDIKREYLDVLLEEIGTDFCDIWNLPDSDGNHRIFVNIPATIPRDLVVSGNRALVTL